MTFDEILVLDTETAGLDGGVCELAFYRLNPDLSVRSQHRSLIDPERPISPQASGIHGITDDDVKDAPTLSEYLGGRFLDKHILLIAHNAPFDVRMVASEIPKVTPLCTLKLARLFYPDAPDHKLQTLMFHFKFTKGNNHSALDDVNTCYELLVKMSKDKEVTLEDLLRIANTPVLIDVMPFGKHKGTPLKQLPKAYVAWLKALDNLDDNLRYSLDRL